MRRCKKCNTIQASYPLFVDSEGLPLEPKNIREKIKNKDWQGFKWKNLFKMDISTIVFLVLVIGMILAYIHDVNQYVEVINNPSNLCNNYNLYEQQRKVNTDIEKFNISINYGNILN